MPYIGNIEAVLGKFFIFPKQGTCPRYSPRENTARAKQNRLLRAPHRRGLVSYLFGFTAANVRFYQFPFFKSSLIWVMFVLFSCRFRIWRGFDRVRPGRRV